MSRIESVSIDKDVVPGAVTAWTDALITCIKRMPLSGWDQDLRVCEPAGRETFKGRIECGSLGDAVVANAGTNFPHRLSLSPLHNPPTQPAPVALLFQTSGGCCVRQSGSSFTLYPGSWCLINGENPFEEKFFGPCNSQLSLFLQRPDDPSLLSLVRRGAARRWDAATGLSRILSATLEEALNEMNHLHHLGETGLHRALAGMAWAAVREQVEEPTGLLNEERRRARIQGYIESQLANHELTVEAIARACAVSVRSVHRAFAANPAGSVSKHIWLRRLSRCAAALRDPRQADRSITDICLSWGFSSTSHFSRLFKERFDVTPREYRAPDVALRGPPDHGGRPA
jgi:AraC family transcriptional regulator, positive regulator of tynA and feaB